MSRITHERFESGECGFWLHEGLRKIGFIPDGKGNIDVFLPASSKNKVAVAFYCGSIKAIEGETNEQLWDRVCPKKVPKGLLFSDS